ncbi:hypothetical protein CQW23_18503 [Capsicum baccatum]|uniref:Uncharacterized protein n=1 Tax=Capsicum baccatum TaxID=33114 RepID=A0A2G2W382_CAPBA|nr:hypothetical protein CQW23_18503 [Capsicum baccatum]
MPSEASTSNSIENDFDHDYNKNEDQPHLDSRLLELLASLGEVYVKRRELIKKMNYEQSMEVFKKMKVTISKNKKWKTQTTMNRSLSVGDGIRNEKYKIKTPHVVIVTTRPNG